MLLVQPDAVLCRLAARGNANAYDVLYQRYRQPVFAFVFHLLGRRDGTEDAEDIAQDVFTRAFAGIRDKSIDGSFKSWIFTIARNRTFDDIRSRKHGAISLDEVTVEMPAAAESTATAEQAEQREELAWLMDTVADLPERQREALLMKELGGMSHNEIAGELGTTVSATKKLISRGRDSVHAAADLDGYRSRRLNRDLAMAAPILPVAAAGIGMTFVGGGAAASGAAAGGVLGGKAAATALTIVAIGGGTAVVEHDRAKPADEADRAPAARQAESNAVALNQSVTATPVLRETQGRHESRGRDSGRGSGDDDRDRSRSRGKRGEREEAGHRHRRGSRGGKDSFSEGESRAADRHSGRGSRSGHGGHSGKDDSPGGGSGSDPSAPEPAEPPEAEDGGRSGSGGGSGSGHGDDGGRGSD